MISRTNDKFTHLPVQAARVLKRLNGVRKVDDRNWVARCPAHSDSNPSLSVSLGDDDRVLLHCHAGCDVEDILDVIDLHVHQLYRPGGLRKPVTKGHGHIPPGDDANLQAGLTLEELAAAKNLPVEYLRGLGVKNQPAKGSLPSCVVMPYHNEDGEVVTVRYRISMTGDRFRWKKGSKAMLYGLGGLGLARSAGYAVLVEGESDAWTLWANDSQCLGVPGASTWKDEWVHYFDGIETVFLVHEPDEGGDKLRDAIAATSLRQRVRVIDLGEQKDPSGLYLDDPQRFSERWAEAMDAAVPLEAVEAREAAAARAEAWVACEALARSTNILERVVETLRSSGLVGEEATVMLLFLILVSRLLDRPVSAVLKGTSSVGKSFLTEQVTRLFPEEAYYKLSAMSEHALIYSTQSLKHRILVINEAAGMGDNATYYLRTLLSEGFLRYETVDRVDDGPHEGRVIEKEGPTGVLLTTTQVRLHPENETRLFSIPVEDSPKQTARVLMALAEKGAGKRRTDLDPAPWHALQRWLALSDRQVVVPFAEDLAKAVPPLAVRLRRDFSAVLNLICSHALLHQASRHRDERGRVVATVADYAAIYSLVGDLVAEGAEATVSATVKETVEAVKAIIADDDSEVAKCSEVSRRLNLDPSAGWRRIRTAIKAGYLVNEETGRGRTARLVVGEPLPDDVEVLPPPERLQACMHRTGGTGNSSLRLGLRKPSCRGLAMPKGLQKQPPRGLRFPR